MKILGWILILPAVWLSMNILQIIIFDVKKQDLASVYIISLIVTLAFAGIVILTNCGGG